MSHHLLKLELDFIHSRIMEISKVIEAKIEFNQFGTKPFGFSFRVKIIIKMNEKKFQLQISNDPFFFSFQKLIGTQYHEIYKTTILQEESIHMRLKKDLAILECILIQEKENY